MKMLLVKKACLLYLAIGMALLPDMLVNNAFGSGPTCPPCAELVFDGHGWRCGGCVIDCGSCYTCNTSTIPPSCADKCNGLDCKYCDGCTTGCISRCSPKYCETCDGAGSCLVCDGNENRFCCNGECYDRRTQGCCGGTIITFATQKCCEDTEPPYVCGKDQACCDGGCVSGCKGIKVMDASV